MKSILIATPEADAVGAIRGCMGVEYRVDIASGLDSCLAAFRENRHEFTFVDVRYLSESRAVDCRKSLQVFWRVFPSSHIVVLAPQDMIRPAVDAVRAGATNYLAYPIDPAEARFVMESAYETLRTKSELDYLRDRFWQDDSLDIVRTNSPLMKEVYGKVRAVAPTRSTVLLVGQTGTGKGLLAKIIHAHSNRKNSRFVSVHCGAIPETLLESELFGHEKGAFTGAHRRKLGRFEIAHKGTIFLDEIGTIPPAAQIKLLHVLQDRTFQRVGGEEDIACDVRVIAASNEDLKKMCEEGRFRADLYYRLSVFPIEIPPLRERPEDIPFLVDLILKKLHRLHGKGIRDVHPSVMEAMKRYDWPGNIRELENLLERAYILESSPVIRPQSLPKDLFPAEEGPFARLLLDPDLSLAEVRRRGIEGVERQYLKEVLSRHRGIIQDSARAAGISARQLHKLLSKYGIRKELFKAGFRKREETEL